MSKLFCVSPGLRVLERQMQQPPGYRPRGYILKVSINTGKIVISKVDILEVGKQDAEAVEAYVHAAVKTMSHEKQVALAARILKLAQQEGGADC